MTSRTSHKSPVLLLRADGSVEPLPLRPGPFQPTLVVLAREHCLFERLDTAASLKASSAAAAARLHAETGAPYQKSGAVITRRGASFGIWWWDAQWVADALAAAGLDPASRILPEPMARASAEGWRIAKASTGYEAQLWRGGFLAADAWRRRAFDEEAWQDFVRVQPDKAGAGDAVLMAQDPPFTLQSPYRKTQLSDWTPERSAQAAMAGLGVLLVASAAWMLGQTAGLNKAARAAEAETAALRAHLPANGASSVQGQVAGLVALRAAVEGADPMVMLENAQQVIKPYNHNLLAYTAERNRIRIILPKDAAADLPAMSRSLLASPFFMAVKPQLDTKRGRLILDLTSKGAKPVKAAV
jgi:hypothetical protein